MPGWEDERCDRDRYRIDSSEIDSVLAYVTMVAGLYVQADGTLDHHTQVVVFVSKFLRLAANMYHGTGCYKVGPFIFCLFP